MILQGYQADLVIVGAGTAGLPAAIEAADRGARVVLLEKQSAIGGMLLVSTGHFSAGGTRLQRERGIEDSVEAHAADIERLSHGKANPALLGRTLPLQREMVDWLEDLGFDFHPDAPFLYQGHEVYNRARTYAGRDGGLSLRRFFERELARRIAAGTIDLRLRMRVSRLLLDAEGRAVGVTAVPADRDGPETEIRAGAVLLATGGFLANRSLVERLLPSPYRTAITGCLDHATGDGLLLAEAAGGALTDFGYYQPTMSLIPNPDRPGFAFDYTEARLALVPATRTPYEVWVNRRGERFVREDTPSPEERERTLLEQPGLEMAVVWDEQILESADPIVIGRPEQPWTRERIAAEARRGRFIWVADTLTDLAGKLGADPGGLQATVARYNRAVSEGRDPDFARQTLPLPIEQPPFYGVLSRAGMLTAREGLRVDANLRVLDRAGAPIEGLYAVGEVLGASQFMGDNTVGGMAVGPAIALGRYVGQWLGTDMRAADAQDAA